MATNLIINGVPREIPDLQTLSELAAWLRLPASGSAMELNGEIVRSTEHPDTALSDGDRLEIIRLVGGG